MQNAKCKMQNFGVCDAYIADARASVPTMVALNVYISVRHCRTPFLFFIIYYFLFHTDAS